MKTVTIDSNCLVSSTYSITTFSSTSLITSNHTSCCHIVMAREPFIDAIDDFNTGNNLAFMNSFNIARICLSVFGLIANTVTGVVLTHKKLWSPTSMLLFSLVAYDAVFLLVSLPPCFMDFTIDAEVYVILLGICFPLRYMAQTGSIYTTVTVTVERYLVVLRPLKARVSCTFGKSRKLVLGIFLFSVLFNVPRCIVTQMYWILPHLQNDSVTENNTDSASYSVNKSDSRSTNPIKDEHQLYSANESFPPITNNDTDIQFYIWLYTDVYEPYVTSVFFYLLPYTLIPVLNLQLLLAIKTRRKETRRISVKNEHRVNYTKPTDLEDGLTMIVLGITVCFFICCLAPAIYNVTQIAKVPPDTVWSYYLLATSDTMLCINASTDFFFYCLLGRRFRNIFLHLFCRRLFVKKSPTFSTHCRATHKSSDTCYHTV